MAQVGQLGPKVSSRLALLCIYHVNQVNSPSGSIMMTALHKLCLVLLLLVL